MDRSTRPFLLAGLTLLALAARAEAGPGAWTTGGPPFGGLGTGARAVAIDLQSPATVYVATTGGVFKSADGGQSWAPTSNGLQGGAALAVVLDPRTPATLYAGMNADAILGSGVFKSTDGAGSWSRKSNGLPTAPFVNVVQAMAIDPVTATTLYAGPGSFGVFESTEGGESWTPLPVSIAICETDAGGKCKASPAPSVSTAILGGINTGTVGAATYAVFVTGTQRVDFDPAANRIFVRFRDLSNVTRGATSRAVGTQ